MNTTTMKKMGISLFVILVFIAYSFQQRSDSESSSALTPVTQTTASTISTASSNAAITTMGQKGSTQMSQMMGQYKDGTYTGTRNDAFYGYIQVKVTISGGKITDVTFLEYPNDQHESRSINRKAMPMLKQEAINAQSANVNGVSGASDTSQAFEQSLSVALNQAKA